MENPPGENNESLEGAGGEENNTPPGGSDDSQSGGGGSKSLDAMSADELRAEIAKKDSLIGKLRPTEAAYKKLQKDHEAAQAKLTEIEQSKLDATEREKVRAEAAEKERDDLRIKVEQRAIRSAVQLEAVKLGFHKPEDAYLFIKTDDVTFDDDGEPEGIEERVKALAKERDYLVNKEQRKNPPNPSANSSREEGQTTPEQDKNARELFHSTTRRRWG